MIGREYAFLGLLVRYLSFPFNSTSIHTLQNSSYITFYPKKASFI
jgi:hypothetical protein